MGGVGGVQGGTHGQILLRACTVYIFDSYNRKKYELKTFFCDRKSAEKNV